MMKKLVAVAAVLTVSVPLFASEPAACAEITVDPGREIRPIGIMNAVNNGPAVKNPNGDQVRGNFEDYKALQIPYARTHDSINCVNGGAHTCDISAVFPDFDADENDPKNYDFVFTDHYLDSMVRAGTKVFYRLGQTIEHGPKKYGVLPPKDFAKWARICEHVVRHYNEGWGWGVDDHPTTVNVAWSNQFNIAYWEIWNEPDLDSWDTKGPNGLPGYPRCWWGTETNFFRLYETTAKHLKAKFPNLKIGGPGLCGNYEWDDRFLAYCRDRQVPLDFHSWHIYSLEPNTVAGLCVKIRRMLDRHGFEKTESILDEWNTVKGWTDDYLYSMNMICGAHEQRGAAFVAATMIACSRQPLDMLMYYDARHTTVFNGMFDRVRLLPLKAYYAFAAWRKLLKLGTEVGCTVAESNGEKSDSMTGVGLDQVSVAAKGQYYAIAAKGKGGKGALFVARYSSDDNTSDTGRVTIRIPGADLENARVLLTDSVRTFTDVPLENATSGSGVIRMQPNSFALVEYDL